ncbi:metal-dependent hydrolase [Candidatus Pacearchaeota archaeon]|nr:metal-dependent hydrolase [Candidatus Pacearchaeota archaeon]
MLLRTHLALGLLGALLVVPTTTHPFIFLPVVLIACLLPDVDSMYSFLGRFPLLRPLQWAVRHRGIIHSFTLCILISVLFALFIPVLALPFFLGYSIHLLSDSATLEGIRPYWPLKIEYAGRIKVGGTFEQGLFYGVMLANVLLVLRFLF